MNWQAWPHCLGSLDREMPQSVQRSRGAALPTVGDAVVQHRDDRVGAGDRRVQLLDGQRAVVRRPTPVTGITQQRERGLGDQTRDDDPSQGRRPVRARGDGRPLEEPDRAPVGVDVDVQRGGVLPRPGICWMSPHSGTSQPAPV